MNKVPITRPFFSDDEAKRIAQVLASGWVTQGPQVQEFEKSFAQYVGSKHAIAVSSCTTALHLSLIAAGIGPGDEVICPSFSFIATANAITYVGAKPVFADIDASTWNLDLKDVQNRVTPKTKAVLLVHQIGNPAPVEDFSEFCFKNSLKLIEDAACAIGSAVGTQRIGSHSDFVCFSFHPRKIITTGDGGMITTSDPEIARRLSLLRQHGMSVSDQVRNQSAKMVFEEYLEVGFNYRMTDLQAAVGIEQMKKLDGILDCRRKIADQYQKSFSGLSRLHLLEAQAGNQWNFQSFPITLLGVSSDQRDLFIQKLLELGVSSRRGMMTAHREPAYQRLGYKTSLPVSEKISDTSLLIPIFPTMATSEAEQVIEAVTETLKAM